MFRAPSRWTNRRNGWRLANRQVPVDVEVPDDNVVRGQEIPEDPPVVFDNNPPNGFDMMDVDPSEDATSSSDVSSSSSSDTDENSGGGSATEEEHMDIDNLNNDDESGITYKLHYVIIIINNIFHVRLGGI